jgi:hypothetical protein
MTSNAGTNAFASAAKSATNLTTGSKGAIQNASTNNLLLDAFVGLKRISTATEIGSMINELVVQINHIPEAERGQWIADIFRLWVHKRHPRSGEKEKAVGRSMFLSLYNHFPNTCIDLVTARIFADMAYWKECLLIWKDIMALEMSDRLRFDKFNPLIIAFRESMMTQRTEDLKALDQFVKPQRIRDVPKDTLVTMLKVNGAKLPSLSWIGKYCVRETSSENKKLYWWISDDTNGRLVRQSHVSFMLRKSLKRKISPGKYEPWGVHESVPFGAKQSWRKLNAKLDEALCVPEVMASLDRIDEIDPTKLPGEFTKRNIKFLLNEKVKKAPTGMEEDTGNRRPDDQERVELRKRTRDMFTDPSKMNVGTLFPHEIAYNARNAKSRATIDYNIASFDKKVLDMETDFEKIRQEMVREAEVASDANRLKAAMTSGRIVGVADVSGSMETNAGGDAPNRPIDIATGMVAFISRIAAEPYRGIAISFTDHPTIFNLKVGDRLMNIQESMAALHIHVGYNTNYQRMHEELIKLCKSNNVPEDELPALYIASDCNFDQMDSTLRPSPSTYNYSTGTYYTNNHASSSTSMWDTTHKTITQMWIRAGYKKVPLMIYHNINVTKSGFEATQNFKGVILLTGRSEQVLKLVLYGEAAGETDEDVVVDGVKTTIKVQNVTPYDTFRKAMEADHFALLESVLLKSHEGYINLVTEDTIGGYTAKSKE